jgi:hypothetical protein
MTNHSRRLDRLEERYQPSAPRKVHRLIGDTRDRQEEQRQEMIVSGEADADDVFIFRLIVDPKLRLNT